MIFVRSLPENSYFNIVSFGSTYRKLWTVSQEYKQQKLDEAVEAIQGMQANMNGTEILKPLQDVLKLPLIKNYPRNIFLLTDGEVTPDPVINLVRQSVTPRIRVYTLGVGDGCSKFLVEKVASVGNGRF